MPNLEVMQWRLPVNPYVIQTFDAGPPDAPFVDRRDIDLTTATPEELAGAEAARRFAAGLSPTFHAAPSNQPAAGQSAPPVVNAPAAKQGISPLWFAGLVLCVWLLAD